MGERRRRREGKCTLSILLLLSFFVVFSFRPSNERSWSDQIKKWDFLDFFNHISVLEFIFLLNFFFFFRFLKGVGLTSLCYLIRFRDGVESHKNKEVFFFLTNCWSSVVASVVLPQFCANLHYVFFFLYLYTHQRFCGHSTSVKIKDDEGRGEGRKLSGKGTQRGFFLVRFDSDFFGALSILK